MGSDPAHIRERSRCSRASLVFVGGTGRSGTHIVGRLLGEHAAFADVPIEARFHCNKRGLPDLLEGRVSLGGFMEKLRDFWWHRIRVDDQPRGLYSLMYRSRLRRRAGALRVVVSLGSDRGQPAPLPRPPVAARRGGGQARPGRDELAQRAGGADATSPLSRGEGDPHGARRPRRGLVGHDQDVGPRRRRQGHRLVGGPPALDRPRRLGRQRTGPSTASRPTASTWSSSTTSSRGAGRRCLEALCALSGHRARRRDARRSSTAR